MLESICFSWKSSFHFENILTFHDINTCINRRTSSSIILCYWLHATVHRPLTLFPTIEAVSFYLFSSFPPRTSFSNIETSSEKSRFSHIIGKALIQCNAVQCNCIICLLAHLSKFQLLLIIII